MHSPRSLHCHVSSAGTVDKYDITDYCTSTPQKPTHFDGHYFSNLSTLYIVVLGYIGIIWPKEHSRSLAHSSCYTLYNYRLTRARRMVECAFGILCSKWRIFHRAIDVRPDFCDVIDKTGRILHNFVRQRDRFHFQDTYTNVPSRVLRLLTLEAMLQGRPWENILRNTLPLTRPRSLAVRNGLKYLVLQTQKMLVLFQDKHAPTDNTVHSILYVKVYFHKLATRCILCYYVLLSLFIKRL